MYWIPRKHVQAKQCVHSQQIKESEGNSFTGFLKRQFYKDKASDDFNIVTVNCLNRESKDQTVLFMLLSEL